MGYLVMIEEAMNIHHPLSLPMLESYWGSNSISKLQSTRKYDALRQYDTIMLSFLCIFWKVTKSVFANWYDKRKSSFTDKGVRMTFLGKII